MSKWIYVPILCSLAVFASCSSENANTNFSPLTTAVNPTSTYPTAVSAEIPGYLSTTLVIIRNGKTYNVILGYDATGEAFHNATPHPNINIDQWYGDVRNIDWVRLKKYGDFDQDGEIEYLVLANRDNQVGFAVILVIDYDNLNDQYRIFDEINLHVPPNLNSIENIEQDGKLEIIGKDEEFHYASGGSDYDYAFAPIKIFRYNGQEFVSVTKEYPDLVTKEANQYLEAMDNVDLVLYRSWYASYLADMYLLGKQDEGIKVFKEACVNYLSPYMLEQDPETTWSCEQFLATVQDALSKLGYD